MSILSRIPFNVLREGKLALLWSVGNFNIMKFLSSCFGFAAVFIPSLAILFSTEVLVLIFTFTQILSILVLLFFPAFSKIAVDFLALGSMVYSLIPCYIIKNYSGNYSRFLLKIAGFSSLILGFVIPSFLTSEIMKFSWVERGSPIFNGKKIYNSVDCIFLLKILLIPVFIGFLLTVVYFIQKKFENLKDKINRF